MSEWCPFAERVTAPVTGGSVTDDTWCGVLHTTESMRYYPSSRSYYGHQNWPHATAWVDGAGRARIAQHIPIRSAAARALRNMGGGVQTNRASCVQIEIAWVAAQAHRMPDALVALVARFMRWCEGELGILPIGPPQGFTPYPRSYGLGNGIRFSGRDWLAFRGWCGHQHVPENDHGDPGEFAPEDAAVLFPGAVTNEEDDVLRKGHRDPGPHQGPVAQMQATIANVYLAFGREVPEGIGELVEREDGRKVWRGDGGYGQKTANALRGAVDLIGLNLGGYGRGRVPLLVLSEPYGDEYTPTVAAYLWAGIERISLAEITPPAPWERQIIARIRAEAGKAGVDEAAVAARVLDRVISDVRLTKVQS